MDRHEPPATTTAAGTIQQYGDVFIASAAGTDTTPPVLTVPASTTLEVGDAFDPMAGVQATDDTDGDLTSQIRISGTVDTSEPGAHALVYTVADANGNQAMVSRAVVVQAAASDEEEPEPTEPQEPAEVDVYSTPGFHNVGGRRWHTDCEPYSQTIRCTTDIWSTVVQVEGSELVSRTGWNFNNLTYLPQMTREQWAGNPLGATGEWTSDEGRRWRTECDTAATGRGGCRSYIWTDLVRSTQATDGSWTHTRDQDWVFNNMVRFSS